METCPGVRLGHMRPLGTTARSQATRLRHLPGTGSKAGQPLAPGSSGAGTQQRQGQGRAKPTSCPRAPLLWGLLQTRCLCGVCVKGDTFQISVITENCGVSQELGEGVGFKLEHQPRSPATDPEGEGRNLSKCQE